MTLATVIPVLQQIFCDNEIVEAVKEGKSFKILFSGLNFYWQVEPNPEETLLIVKNRNNFVGVYTPAGVKVG